MQNDWWLRCSPCEAVSWFLNPNVVNVTHSFTHSPSHALTHPLTYTCTHPLADSLTHPHSYLFNHPLTYSLTHTPTCSLIHWSIHSYTLTSLKRVTLASMFAWSPVHLFLHTCIWCSNIKERSHVLCSATYRDQGSQQCPVNRNFTVCCLLTGITYPLNGHI